MDPLSPPPPPPSPAQPPTVPVAVTPSAPDLPPVAPSGPIGPPSAPEPSAPEPSAPEAATPRRGWPTSALVAVILALLAAIGGIVVGQLQVKQQKDEVAELRDDLADTEDDADAEIDELETQLGAAQVAADEAAAAAGSTAEELLAAQEATAAAAADAQAKQATIDDLNAQLAAQQGATGIFPVSLEDFAKVDLTASAVSLKTDAITCTYNDETCGALQNPALDMDIYLDNDQWNVTVRDNGSAYFQAKLVLDASGSFSGSEYVNADGTCADGSAAKPFATIFINPVEFTVVDGKVRTLRFRGYLEDLMECGDVDPRSTLVFEGRAA